MTSGASAWLVDERWFKAYPLSGETTIGRGAASTVILRDPAVSRTHAEIKPSGGGYVLYAHGASGTNVNGLRVASEYRLQEGDVIEIAFSALRFTMLAPTGEMFVVPRDAPTSRDRLDVPTRATLHAMHPITLVARSRRYWHWILLAILVVLAVTICAGRTL